MSFKQAFQIFVLCSLVSCTGHYRMDDFTKVKKIDAHVHLHTTDTFFLDQAFKDNFSLITINTEIYAGQLQEQEEIATILTRRFPQQVHYLSAFSTKNWDSASWADSALACIIRSKENGASGIKLWKNIGTTLRDKDSNFVTIDNPKFDTIFSFLEQHHIPVLGHFGDPKNGWLPVEKMTIRGDSNYFANHPEYHFYNHPEIPHYTAQNVARDHVLDRHPNLIFSGAHLASLEWSVDTLAAWFDKYPAATVDLAGRICYFEQQAIDNHQKVRDFIMKYHDRFIYGTDLGSRKDDTDTEGTKRYCHGIWLHDWQFFVTADTMTSSQFQGKFCGLLLPKEVVEDIYYNNAERVYLK